MSVPNPKMLVFFQDLERLTEVFGRMFAGTSKLPLRADFFVSDCSWLAQVAGPRGDMASYAC